MSDAASAVGAADAVRDRTGIVIPVYFPIGVDRSVGEGLLQDNVAACVRQLADPGRICLSVDGEGCGEEITAGLKAQWGVQCCTAPENKGKLQAVRLGVWLNPVDLTDQDIVPVRSYVFDTFRLDTSHGQPVSQLIRGEFNVNVFFEPRKRNFHDLRVQCCKL